MVVGLSRLVTRIAEGRDPAGHTARSGAPPADSEWARSLFDRVDRLRADVLDRVQEVNRISEKAVLSTGESLRAVVATARSFVERTAHLGRHVEEDSEQGLAAATGDQMRAAQSFSEDMCTLIARQDHHAADAVTALHSIGRAGREIERLVNASRMLALNAQIEAARMGDAGRAFGVVAGEMKAFAQEMARANAAVASLVEELRGTLPRIAGEAEAMKDRSRQFNEGFQANAERVRAESEELRRAVHELVSAGADTIDTVVRHAESAISALQFQDPQSQSLLMIDEVAQAAEEELALSLGIDAGEVRPAVLQKVGEGGASACEAGAVMLL